MLAKVKEAEAADAKRNQIMSEKAKKMAEFNQKLQIIDQERAIRRNKRINSSLPDRGISSMSSRASMVSDISEFKEMLWDKDAKLKHLQAKIMARKQGLMTNY